MYCAGYVVCMYYKCEAENMGGVLPKLVETGFVSQKRPTNLQSVYFGIEKSL